MSRKVLFTASTYSHIVNFHLPYLRKFQEKGWMIHVACGGKPMNVPYADELIVFSLKKTMWTPENFKAAVALSDKMRKEKYTLICTHTSLAAFFTRLALWGLEERPLVVNMVHGYLFDDETPWMKRNLLLTAERCMAPVTDLVLTMNQWDHKTSVKYQLGQKIVQVPGVGVDFSRLDGVYPNARQCLRSKLDIPQDSFVLLYPAEFSARKSQSVLIRALTLLPEQVILVLAGKGALWEECRTLADKLGVANRVRFPGHVNGIGPWYAMADAAVSASRSEGLPFNIMEAMYMGLPVVASDVKGHSDLISEAETGLLYPYGDETACAEQVWKLLGSKGLRQRLGGNAKRYVERYALEQVLPAVWKQYAGLFAAAAYSHKR